MLCRSEPGESLRMQDTDRDFFMGAEEAVEYGLIDAVISRPQLIAATNGAQY